MLAPSTTQRAATERSARPNDFTTCKPHLDWTEDKLPQRGSLDPDRLPAVQRARQAIRSSHGPDLGDELRRQAESLAYQASKNYESALRRIESQLVSATGADDGFSEAVSSMTLDIVRTYMCRGLMRAQLEAGDHTTFWVRR